MPLVLRQVRSNRWYSREECPWLAEGELQADPLGDLQTNENMLSVWFVEDDKSNFRRIITALAANRDYVQNFDYILIDEWILHEIGIKFKNSEAVTPDEDANSKWHYDLIELSAQKLTYLAKAILDTAEPQRISKKQVKQWIKDAVINRFIDSNKLKGKVEEEIES